MDDVERQSSLKRAVQVVVGTAAIAVAVIHAAMSGVTTRPSVDARLFALAAVVGAVCGIAVLLRPSPEVLSVTVAVHAVFLGAWFLSRTVGLPVAGMHVRQSVDVTDAVAAVLSAVVVGGGAWLVIAHPGARRVARFAPSLSVLAVVAVSVPALLASSQAGSTLVSAASRSAARSTTTTALTVAPHVHPGTEGVTGADAVLHPAGDDHGTSTTPTKPFDPSTPIDLSGTPGVTQVQQKQAELLLAQTLAVLPQFDDPAVAVARGYHSIGDALTGDEHYMNWALINDSHILDPNFPESLVYDTRGGKKVLEAAMFILPSGYTLDNVPQVGGGLIQWHIHDNLCFTLGDQPVLAGFHLPAQPCRAGTQAFTPTPMIHVWIQPNQCGPFAALEGVGAGQVKAGQVRSCDHAHGSTNSTF